MSQPSIEHSYMLFVRFLMLSKRRAIELGTEHGLTGMQAILLFLLDEPHPMSSFRKLLNCDASNITGLVDGLEEKNLAERFSDSDDRRIKMVKLTSTGTRLRGRLIKQAAGNDSLLARLSPEERNTFTALLQKITDGAALLL